MTFAAAFLGWIQPAMAHHSFAALLTEDGGDVIAIYDGTVEISLALAGTEDSPYYRRRFEPKETQEVRIYLHAGNDRVVSEGPANGTIKVRVEFPNPDALILPGQFMNVTLVSSDPEDQMVVPQVAVQANQAGPFVLVVNKDNEVELRPVKTGQRVGTEIAVTEGLYVGETIIIEGIQKVRPGAKVNPVMQKMAR